MKKILTIIFDGFGLREEDKGNAILKANMNVYNQFFDNNPHSILDASEEHVGLLPGQMGNSEVGHSTIGAGRILLSDMSKINKFFDEDYENNETFLNLVSDKDKRVHLMGICSDGNIHGSIEYFIRMTSLLVKNGIKNIYYHLITDGRDTKVNVSYKYIAKIQKLIDKMGYGCISSVCGRYYAMDRDENYNRTKMYYDLVTQGKGDLTNNIEKTILESYANDITDEFLKPIIVNKDGLIKDNDTVIWLNYRNDRAKQILSAFLDPKFNEFNQLLYSNIDFYSFFPVDKNLKIKSFMENEDIKNCLGLYLSKLDIKQARIAESEKYPHVTYFFDGGYDGKISGCDKFNIPSPEVATYDMQPHMSAIEVTKKIIDCMEKDYDFILANYANPDMVGHTGNMEATVKACMTLDICLGKVLEKADENFYTVILLADHGNADTMINSDGSACTTHSLAKVPFIINDKKVELKESGDLSNVAPTILDYMDIMIPEEMTSDSLIK